MLLTGSAASESKGTQPAQIIKGKALFNSLDMKK
jgi:hypothetical protein